MRVGRDLRPATALRPKEHSCANPHFTAICVARRQGRRRWPAAGHFGDGFDVSPPLRTCARNIVKRILEKLRYVVVIAVAGLTVTMAVTFAWAIAKTARLIGTLLDGGWRSDLSMVDLLEVIDTYLLAIVQLIVAIGLYELFIGALDVPEWLKARSLEDLKKSIVDVLIVFIGVKGVEQLVAVQEPIDALTYTAAVAILIAALSLFRWKPSRYDALGPPSTTGGTPAQAGALQTRAHHESDEVSGPNTSAS